MENYLLNLPTTAQVNELRQWVIKYFLNEHRTNRYIDKKECYIDYCQQVGNDLPALNLTKWTHELATYVTSLNLEYNPLDVCYTIKAKTHNRCIIRKRGQIKECIYLHDKALNSIPEFHRKHNKK